MEEINNVQAGKNILSIQSISKNAD